MNVGTKSLLFGVHQFLWHPWTVGRAYRHVHGVWPMFDEWLCIFVHDWGYWGSPNMDGEEGKRHPEHGALIATSLVYWWFRLKILFWRKIHSPHFIAMLYASEAYERTLYHSSHYARTKGKRSSALCLPDKLCILFEPEWFYLLRSRASGEVRESIQIALDSKVWPLTTRLWFSKLPRHKQSKLWYDWYRRKVQKLAHK